MSTKPLAINADAGAPEYAAIDQRRNQAMLLTQGVGDGLGARAGVRPGGSPAITLAGQTITIHPRPVVVYPAETSTDGPYIGHLDDDTHTLDPADGTNDRIDIVVVRVYDDDHDASGRRELVTEYITGTPAADPDPPSAPAGTFVGAEINVFSGGSPSPTLEYVAPFTVAAGGIVPVRDDSEGPSAGLYHGMVRYRQDTDTMEVWDSSAWTPIAQRGGWETLIQQNITSTTVFDITLSGRYPAGTFDMIQVTCRGAMTALENLTLRINNDSTSNLHRRSYFVYDPNADNYPVTIVDDGTVWYMAQWSTSDSNYARGLIIGTDQSSTLSFDAYGYRAATSNTLRHKSWGSGDLASARLVDSIRISAGGAEFPDDCDVIIEGHRPIT